MKVIFVSLFFIVKCFAGEADAVKIDAAKISFAKKPNGDYECTIVGNGVILTDPSRSYFDLVHVTSDGSKNYMPIRSNRTRLHWKFLIILMENREAPLSLNTYKFDILKEDLMNANYRDSGEFRPVGLRLFWSDYGLFDKNGLSAMKLHELK